MPVLGGPYEAAKCMKGLVLSAIRACNLSSMTFTFHHRFISREPPHPLPVILCVNSLPFLRFLDQARFNGLGKGENPPRAHLDSPYFGDRP